MSPGEAVPVPPPARRLPPWPEQPPLTFLLRGTATPRPEQRQHRPEQQHRRRHHGSDLSPLRELPPSGSGACGAARAVRGCRSCATHQPRPAEEAGGAGSSSGPATGAGHAGKRGNTGMRSSGLGNRAGDVRRGKRCCRRKGFALCQLQPLQGCSWMTRVGYLWIKS